MELTKETKELIQKYKHYIETNQFDLLFSKIQSEIVPQATSRFCNALTSAGIDFLKHMTYIPEGCFYGSMLERFTIPSNITKINWEAFAFSDLQNIVIPSSVKYIEPQAFEACYDLRHVVFDEGCKIIDTFCFTSCDSLKSIVLPSTLTKIGGGIFSGCSDSLTITFTGTKEEWNKIVQHNHTFSGCNVGYVSCANGTVILN